MNKNYKQSALKLAEYIGDNDSETEAMKELARSGGNPEDSILYHVSVIGGWEPEFYEEWNEAKKSKQ